MPRDHFTRAYQCDGFLLVLISYPGGHTDQVYFDCNEYEDESHDGARAEECRYDDLPPGAKVYFDKQTER